MLSIIAALVCINNPVYCQIQKNNPGLDSRYISALSSQINIACKKWQVPCNIYTAILMQESSYRLNVRSGDDYGIAQINTIIHDFDKTKLLTDLEYSVNAGAQVLAHFKHRADREPDWWVRYNIGYKPLTKARKVYKMKVEEYLK